jgi:hypothetical protein
MNPEEEKLYDQRRQRIKELREMLEHSPSKLEPRRLAQGSIRLPLCWKILATFLTPVQRETHVLDLPRHQLRMALRALRFHALK